MLPPPKKKIIINCKLSEMMGEVIQFMSSYLQKMYMLDCSCSGFIFRVLSSILFEILEFVS